jgi:hypothetical protein
MDTVPNGKPVALVAASLDGRWRAGELDMQAALARFSAGDDLPTLNVIRRAAA